MIDLNSAMPLYRGFLETCLVRRNPCQQISQAVSGKNYPSVSNLARINNVADRKHRSRCDHRAVLILASRRTDQSTVEVSNLCRNLEALLRPRLKASVLKFALS